MNSVAPFLVFFLGAVLVAMTRGRVRAAVLLAIPLVGAFNLFTIADAAVGNVAVFEKDETLRYGQQCKNIGRDKVLADPEPDDQRAAASGCHQPIRLRGTDDA